MFLRLRQGAEGEDEVDSDFSIDENDEPVSDHGDEEKKKRRKPGAFTKVYKVKIIILFSCFFLLF